MPQPLSKRQTVKDLICGGPGVGLGYCCEYAFFRLHGQTSYIAERLGVGVRAVRYHKAAAKQSICAGAATCLKGRLF